MEGSSIPASGEDLAVTFRLPFEYHGVVVQPDPGRKLLSLKVAFMDASFEPEPSSRNFGEVVAGRVEERTGFF